MHMTDHIFPDTERNSKQAAEYNIQNQPQIVARQDIVIPLLVDHIRHIARQHRIERSSCQQGEDKNIKWSNKKITVDRIEMLKNIGDPEYIKKCLDVFCFDINNYCDYTR